jgi:hypothetical protein
MPNEEDDPAPDIATLARVLGLGVRPEHLQEVALAWALMAPHRAMVMGTELGPADEPAPVFWP